MTPWTNARIETFSNKARAPDTKMDEGTPTTRLEHVLITSITLLSVDLWRNYYIKNVVLFEENSILLLPESLESSEW